MPKYVLRVPNISCHHCGMRISKSLEEIGEKNFEVNVAEKQITIETDQIDRVLDRLQEIDYPVVEYRFVDV